MNRRRPRWAILALAITSACAAPTDLGPPEAETTSFQSVSESALRFFRNAPGAPGLATLSTSFYAKKGETREVELYYHATPGVPDSTRLLRFRVEKRALAVRPDGTPFADGDSVLITISVADSSQLIVDFEPSGLGFDNKHPARLWFWWSETDPDLNHDGLVNAADTTALVSSAIWAQETPVSLWDRLTTVLELGGHEAEAKVYGFTRYALAY